MKCKAFKEYIPFNHFADLERQLRGKDVGETWIHPSGKKMIGVTRVNDTMRIDRVEYPDGEKHFDNVIYPKGGDINETTARVEGQGMILFEVTRFADGSSKYARAEYWNGTKTFSIVHRDGVETVERTQRPDGEVRFGKTTAIGSKKQHFERIESADSTKMFDVTITRLPTTSSSARASKQRTQSKQMLPTATPMT